MQAVSSNYFSNKTAAAATGTAASFRRGGASNDPAQLVTIQIPINYEKELDLIKSFIQHFEPSSSMKGGKFPAFDVDDEIAAAKALAFGEASATHGPKYMQMLQEVANLQSTSITIDLDDMVEFGERGEDEKMLQLVEHIERNTYHYLTLLSTAIDQLMPEATIACDLADMDVVDVIANHRKAKLRAKNATEEEIERAVPRSLLRRYSVYLHPRSTVKAVSVRQVRSEHVGRLIRLRGIVTRVTEVKPLLLVGTYSCEQCGYEVYQEVTTTAFMPLPQCPSEECRRNGLKGQLFLQSRGSKFCKYQEARIQELTDQVPIGHIPRSMAIHLLGDQTRQLGPGDHVIVSGIYMPKPYTGFKAIKAGLLTDTYLLAQGITQLKPRLDALHHHLDDGTMARIERLSQDPQVFAKLASAIAPEIYGHEEVKKALLLLMVGGVTRSLPDGMKIRGDINVCLMGDPGVAKSQLLKFVTKIAPRAVYTTGKGSSGVGLTAAVSRDSVTGEMVLEGGALVLADNGICCIDEFDKMDEHDRTSIHEVMEQQTISISKAGITTTLNARTSILAAANPLHGRYNPKRSPRDNINLPPALLSRFDLLFLLLDRPDLDLDTRLAEHVTEVHRTNKAPEPTSLLLDNDDEPAVDTCTLLRHYIGMARRYEPVVPSALTDYIVGAYVSLRLHDLDQKDTTYTTPRTLLAVLRLSQALAKLRFTNTVIQADVDEAMRLMDVSRSSIDVHLERRHKTSGGAFDATADAVTRIYSYIRDLANATTDGSSSSKELPMEVIREGVRGRGFTDEQLQRCLVEFDQCDIWSVSPCGTILKIFN